MSDGTEAKGDTEQSSIKQARGDTGQRAFSNTTPPYKRFKTNRHHKKGFRGQPRIIARDEDFPCRGCGGDLISESAIAMGICVWCISAAKYKNVSVATPSYRVPILED